MNNNCYTNHYRKKGLLVERQQEINLLYTKIYVDICERKKPFRIKNQLTPLDYNAK